MSTTMIFLKGGQRETAQCPTFLLDHCIPIFQGLDQLVQDSNLKLQACHFSTTIGHQYVTFVQHTTHSMANAMSETHDLFPWWKFAIWPQTAHWICCVTQEHK
uniref:Uncharacterized protein n=1 Tax=Eutreptiella gymnastica TaxID=73025 RepID=A0A7S4FR30_9EUGL